ncbi:hypothetical protein TRFO_38107 [Tritrichomonas foetus]|uniref:Uncharacterized protein n=1 Tax=Tritrichomonas foetus TaxID=1144522 RepID=A0A1J4JAT2_9EUKA|nr:hypothetical protein TRFO_38107 [Tritrichomonas foetus]|eukprot:OHS95777.1 hypothetical protein TRFO_38107 [Tritrichomonas foetus]
MIIIEEKEKNMQLLNRRFTDSMQKLKEEWQAEINSVQQGKIFNSNYYPASSLPSSVNAENKLQNSINIFNVDIQSKYKASEARLRKMYNIEKEAIENNYSTKYSSLIHLKEQKLHPLSQRLEHLKRQRYEMSKEQMKFSSQSDLLKPKAASSRPSRNLSNKITSFLKNPRLNLIPITPIQYQLARPRTPGGPTICKPRAQNDGSYFH